PAIHESRAAANMAAMAVIVEGLEERRLLAGPQGVGIHMVGPEPKVTAVVLTCSDRLDPVSAQNPDAYFVGREVVLDDVGWDPLGPRARTAGTRGTNPQAAAGGG